MGFLRTLFVFGTGVYSGIYLSQNYNVPEVDKPQELADKFKAYVEELQKQYRKDK